MNARPVLFASFLTVGLLVLVPQPAAEGDGGTTPAPFLITERFADAEQDYTEGSFARAHERYQEFDKLDLPEDEARWVDFRLADTLWRSQAAAANADTTLLDQARLGLEVLVRDISRVEDRDAVWVEVQESLGDFWWGRRNSRNWGAAWSYYQAALDWWAGSADIGPARGRYLAIVWKVAEPPEVQPYYSYGYYGNYLPVSILENALEIAAATDEQARAHYLLAMTLRQQGGDWKQLRRVPEEFEAALAAGQGSNWYDDALFHLAQWWADRGRITLQEDGNWTQENDYVEAVSLYRRLLREFNKGETRYYDQARQQIDHITKPVVGAGVSNIFLPGSEIEYHLNWRNVRRLELSLYALDLLTDPRFQDDSGAGQWLQQLDLPGREPYASWSFDTEDGGEHRPGRKTLRLDDELPAGAYVLLARGEGETARDLILVSDASLVMTVSGKKVLLYACDVLDGSPLAGADVKLWERTYDGKRHIWRAYPATADEQGLALFDIPRTPQDRSYRELFAVAGSGRRQSFATGNRHYRSKAEPRWHIQAFTDRPAYRPNETVRWKVVARRHDGSVYSTPAGQTLVYEITDPQGAKVSEGSVSLNSFGSAWGELEVNESMPLGPYQVQYRSGDRNRHIGSAMLFRLEEYKLPEFRVRIETPEDDAGSRKAFRLGDTVEVGIQADYYFGGPVGNATVEVLVYQNPFAHYWAPPRDYPWLYEDMMPRRGGWGHGGQVVQRETVRTDASGRAVVRFDTSASAGQDLEYRVEARVTDASRREVVASDTVRVGRQGYYVYSRARHYLHRPADEATIDFRALDANKNPKQVSGKVKVSRDTYVEIWVDPQGREVRGDELQRMRRRLPVFPPPPASPGGSGWQLRFNGYEHEDILTRTLKTDAEGNAELSFVPQREGYYRVAWSSEDDGHGLVTAETTVWVATGSTTELGYRHGGVEIIVDRDTFRAGEKAAVMLVAPTNDRYVLLTVAGEELYSHQLVHVTGTVKLLQLDIGEEHVPNIFLTATMVSDGDSFQDIEQVVVPPVKNFLEVDVSYDREDYQPREKGFVTVRTTDHEGRPVSAEVSLGVTDESIYYIQEDPAQDPRQFFFGSKRGLLVRTMSTLQQRRYRKLDATDEDSGVVDGERENNELYRGRDDMMVAGQMADARMEGAKKSMSSMDYAAAPMAMEEAAMEPSGVAGGAGAAQPAVQVRSDFRSTMFWQPDVVTGDDGKARVEVTFPDSLTSWRATARVQARDQRFGMEKAAARTRKPLIVRLQAPRFFVVGDRLTVSAILNNNTGDAMAVSPSLEAEGLLVRGGAGQVQVPAGGETRVDWQVEVESAGPATLTVTGRGSEHADAMRREFRVYEHGVEKFLSRSGKVRGEEVLVTLDLPARRQGSEQMVVQIAPSMAVTMLDALPYLIDYPYGCTEQTMSRFLPAAIVARTLADAGLDAEAMAGKMFGGIESEYAGSTHSKGKQDLELLEDMIDKGLSRLYDFQHGDGGWGWWKDGESDHYMTAYVVWGLTLARQAGIEVRSRAVERAVSFLEKEIVEEERRHDLAAWMLHALAAHHGEAGRATPSRFTGAAFDKLWESRAKLNAYTRALLALSAHYLGDAERAQTLVRNLENGVQRDETPDTSVVQRGSSSSHDAVQGTAHWGADGAYRRWSEGGVETTAFALRALLAIDPASELVEPVTNWLLKNRRGAQWSNTRDTAMVVLTLNDYLRVSGELEADVDYEVLVNGRSVQRRQLAGADALAAPSRLAVDPAWLRDGANEVRIVRHGGRGPLYFATELAFFSLEEPVTAAGNEIFVRRQYHKLVPRPTLLKGVVLEKVSLNDGDEVRSGERVEVVLTIEAKNDYEYLVFEDLKPAGLEAVQVRSGEALYARQLKSGAVQQRFGRTEEPSAGVQGSDLTGRSRYVYQELRDRKVALFLDKLPQGVWEIRYELRAEIPGSFHALPVLGHAMYVPEIRCNGAEIRITVLDRE